ncbi:MAG: hypothetical protein KAS36_08685 [Anaerolineales bacterium]|nr:hypothetical protein [Anaerolineales bacterium]
MSDISDRTGGFTILLIMGAIGAIVGLSYFMHPVLALLIVLGVLLAYVGVIALIYNTDPFVWTVKTMGEFFDKRRGG